MPLNFSQMNTADKVSLVTVTLLPIAALAGNSVADIALVVNVVVLLAMSGENFKSFLQSTFLRLSFAFWGWILICSAVSAFPSHSFQDSLPWIRFPLYAFALSQFLTSKKSMHMRFFVGAAILGSLIEAGFLFREYALAALSDIPNLNHVRLYGTFSKPIPGWYLVCFGLIGAMSALQLLKASNASRFQRFSAILFFIVTTLAVVLTGEVMNTAVYTAAILLFLFLRPLQEWKNLVLVGGGTVVIVAVLGSVIWLDPALHQRLMISAIKRLPWLASSDYNLAWTTGVTMAVENPLFGVGPKNFNLYCLSLKEAGSLEAILGITECQWHPHNLYLQIASESGIIGLLLFAVLSSYLFIIAYRHSVAALWQDNIPIILTFVLFFPIQTYSQAFGQSKNFFVWTVVGFILAKIREKLSNANAYDKPTV